MKTRLFIAVFAIILIFQIARESFGWAIITGSFAFMILVWLNHDPESKEARAKRDRKIAQEARNQRELIKGGEK